jgi:hypothetical protein
MVKPENIPYCVANQYVIDFLTTNGQQELIDLWKEKANLQKFKKRMKLHKTELPKRPKSSFIYYCDVMRPIVKKEMETQVKQDPNYKEGSPVIINIQKVTSVLGERWKWHEDNLHIPAEMELSEQLKDLARQDQERYRKEKSILTNTNNTNKQKDTTNHLRSLYLFFGQEQRLINPSIKMKEIAALWQDQKHDISLLERYKKECSAAGSSFKNHPPSAAGEVPPAEVGPDA